MPVFVPYLETAIKKVSDPGLILNVTKDRYFKLTRFSMNFSKKSRFKVTDLLLFLAEKFFHLFGTATISYNDVYPERNPEPNNNSKSGQKLLIRNLA
jgi:hypothetical protein